MLELLGEVAPVLAFLVAVTLVAEIADLAGLFRVAGDAAARLGRGRTWVLWLLVVSLATAVTIVLSLDATAVLLTPVVIVMARRSGISPLPFAMATLWLANTASLLLPVSNLTNLLALRGFAGGTSQYLGLSWRPAVALVVVTVGLLALLHRRALRGGYRVPDSEPVADPLLAYVSGVVCLAMVPFFVLGVPPWIPAAIAAALLLALLAWRDRPLLRRIEVPWQMVLALAVLFVLVELAREHGLDDAVRAAAGTGTDLPDLLRLAGVAALGANAMNNLPAYLALHSVAGDPVRQMAVLIGVNAGPVITLWASLATVLWRGRCRRAGLDVPVRTLAWQGALLAPLAVLAGVLALAL